MSETKEITPKKLGRPRKKLGRPTIMTKAVLEKLEDAFAMGCTDAQACFYAGISVAPLFKYMERNPQFRERRAALKENPVLLARSTVIKALKNDVDTAKWYLERRERAEFGQKIEQDTNINVTFHNNLPRPNTKAIQDHAISSVPKVIDAEIVPKRR